MKVTDYLKRVAYVIPSENLFDGSDTEEYRSKFDNSYITLVGMEDNVKFLADREITEELTHGVGFSTKDGKWYGWSHRAICGFEVGSTCEKGDCHYVADNPEEMIDNHVTFFSDISKECADQARAECQILEDRSGIRILHAPVKLPIASDVGELLEEMEAPGSLEDQIMSCPAYTEYKCGKGAWIAETIEDAKQMAIEFNESVS